MATTYAYPGVYVEEVDQSAARPIAAVGTSVTAFLGEAPAGDANVNQPRAINTWGEFARIYAPAGSTATHLARAVFGYFSNGGSRCWVVNVGRGNPIAGDARGRKGIQALLGNEEFATVAAPGYSDPASHEALIGFAEKQRVFAILDAAEDVGDPSKLTKVATAPAPARRPRRTGGEGESSEVAPSGDGDGGGGARPRVTDGGFAALYYPWIRVMDPFSPGDLIDVPPSGHLAGIFARTDSGRGVHKAPANEPVRGALNVNYRLTDEEQGVLNDAGVNCIRFFPGEGIRVWGARTLASSSSPWRYLNVRRLFNMIEKSIARSTRWVVFEPNDHRLWKSIRRDVSAFLRLLWRQGALMGRTPEQAFFVQCDEGTNPEEVVNEGQVVTVVGIAPVKPAEFVIFRIGQGVGRTEVEG